jgi:hypothetical protein
MGQSDLLIPLWTKKGQSSSFGWKSERPVLVAVEALGAVIHGQMIQLNATSARIMLDEPCLLCNKVRTNVRFRSEDMVYFLSGKAMSSECDESITLEFDDVTRKDMAMLRALGIASAAHRTPEEHKPSAPPVKRKRTKEEQRRVLYLPPPNGIERRMDRRHELEVNANLMIVDKGITLRCTLLEVSVSGCRLFSEAPFNLPPDVRVEVDFIGLGHPFRLAAELKLKEDQHLVGLRFAPMSCRCNERLLELVGDLVERDANLL